MQTCDHSLIKRAPCSDSERLLWLRIRGRESQRVRQVPFNVAMLDGTWAFDRPDALSDQHHALVLLRIHLVLGYGVVFFIAKICSRIQGCWDPVSFEFVAGYIYACKDARLQKARPAHATLERQLAKTVEAVYETK